MKWIKKRIYLILLIMTGGLYLTFADHWQIYAAPYEKIKTRIEAIAEDFLKARNRGDDGNSEKAEAVPGTEKSSEGMEASSGEEEVADAELSSEGMGAPSGEEGIADAESSSAGVGAPLGEEGVSGEGESLGDTPQQGGEPAYITVEDDYFADAVFIGDSRTVGMYEYGGLEETATFYASTGLTVYKLFSAEIVTVPGQKKKISVEDALQQNTFAKIYLMVGINEMGTGTVETFTEKYEEVVQHLQELQPDAVIYIQGIMKVTTERSNQGDYINNEGIEARNAELEKLADNQRIFYLDVNPLICDETGGMVPSYTFDGVHLKAKYVELWKEFLKEHAVTGYDI